MSPWLLLILIVVGNLCLYWVLFGRKRFEQQFQKEVEEEWRNER